jgi:hypothetical protein
MKMNLLSLLVLSLFFVGTTEAFWLRKPTRKEIIYLKTKAFFGNKLTISALSMSAGVCAVLALQRYQQYAQQNRLGNLFQQHAGNGN